MGAWIFFLTHLVVVANIKVGHDLYAINGGYWRSKILFMPSFLMQDGDGKSHQKYSFKESFPWFYLNAFLRQYSAYWFSLLFVIGLMKRPVWRLMHQPRPFGNYLDIVLPTIELLVPRLVNTLSRPSLLSKF